MITRRTFPILAILLYALSAVVLLLGLVAGFSIFASGANVHNLLLPLQLLGAEAISNLIAPYLTGLVNGLGVFTLIVSLVLSLLLFTAGRLLAHIASLEARLARLEAQPNPLP